jgi:hypothetical protein
MWFVPAALFALVPLLTAPAFGYSTYSDGCIVCHGDFNSGTYVSNKDGTNWGTDLMSGHLQFISSCDTCHWSGPRSPVYTYQSVGDTFLKSCLGGTNDGAACTASSQCPGGICAMAATKM